jgi:hypothetical protein
MHVIVGIAHAAFVPERRDTLQRLMARVPDAHVMRSERREHASVWARRLWEWAAQHDDAHALLLNDDVMVPRGIVDIVRAMVAAVPDHVIALHTTAPAARSLITSGERWLRSYWLTGPGYVLPPGVARRLLEFASSHPTLAAAVNEDNLVMHWAWHEQRPIWHSLPALVEHDTSVSSTLGYDHHPGRVTTVPWHAHVVTLDDVDAWRPTGEPVLVECPWMPRAQLAATERAMYRSGGAICGMCMERAPIVGRPGGLQLCGTCVTAMVDTLARAAQ